MAGEVQVKGLEDVHCTSLTISFEMKSYQIKSWGEGGWTRTLSYP